MSGRPTEKHISAQEFCKMCTRSRLAAPMDEKLLVVCLGKNVRRIGDQKSRNQSTVHVVSMTPFRGPHQISSCNSENVTFSNTFCHSPQGLPQLKLHIYQEAIIPSCATIGGYCLSPLFFPPFYPCQKITLQTFSTLLSNQTRFSGCTPTVQRQLLFLHRHDASSQWLQLHQWHQRQYFPFHIRISRRRPSR